MNKFLAAISLGLLLVTAGCSSPNKPTAANFKNALMRHFKEEKKSVCLYSGYNMQMPYIQTHNPFITDHSGGRFQAHLEALTDLGLIKDGGKTKKKVGSWDMDATVWELTSKGEELYNQQEDRFCFDVTPSVEIQDFEIHESTDPQPTNVLFTLSFNDLPTVAQSAIKKGFSLTYGYSRFDPKQKTQGTASVKLMASGWKVVGLSIR